MQTALQTLIASLYKLKGAKQRPEQTPAQMAQTHRGARAASASQGPRGVGLTQENTKKTGAIMHEAQPHR